MKYMKHLIVSVFLMVFALSSQGASYQHLLPAQSHISFAYQQFHLPLTGHMAQFSGKLWFDELHPERSYVDIHVDTTSVRTGSADGDKQSQSALWLDAAHFPDASFHSTRMIKQDSSHYQVAGILTIKGRPLATVSFPVQVIHRDGQVVMEGDFDFPRRWFHLGDASAAADTMLSPHIQIMFKMVAN